MKATTNAAGFRVALILLSAATTIMGDQSSTGTVTVIVGAQSSTGAASGRNYTTSREIAASCGLVEERAIRYFQDHDLFNGSATEDDGLVVYLRNYKNPSTPSGTPLSLTRFSIHKYTRFRYLSPLRSYSDFQLVGRLRLANRTDGSCTAALRFEISAFEYAWPLAVIDDGYRSDFISNGTLERLYLAAIDDLSTKPKP